jgi:hypothetical protein
MEGALLSLLLMMLPLSNPVLHIHELVVYKTIILLEHHVP